MYQSGVNDNIRILSFNGPICSNYFKGFTLAASLHSRIVVGVNYIYHKDFKHVGRH